MTARARPARRPIARIAATLLRPVLSPATVFRMTGILPWAGSPVAPSVLQEGPDTPPFTARAPSTRGRAGDWRTSSRVRAPCTQVACVGEGIALDSGAVFDRRGRFIESASQDWEFVDSPRRRRRGFMPDRSGPFPAIPRVPHAVVALTTSNQGFYFHWIFDVLPRFRLAELAGYGDGPFYVRAELPFQRQTLDLLGVPEERRIDAGRSRVVSASPLVVPCHSIVPGHVFPDWAIRFLRDRLLPAARAAEGSWGRRIYVSRRSAGHRRVSNEAEVVAFLARHGFRAIEAEELGFPEQAALFRDAEVVVAPHGGGLTNLVFCGPGTTVIELFPTVNIDLYYRLATGLELDYHFVKSADPPRSFMGPEDYHIAVPDLERTLEFALSARAR